MCISEVYKVEKFYHFSEGLKNKILVEVYKSGCTSYSEVTKVALSVDSIMWGCSARDEIQPFLDFLRPSSQPTPTVIGIVQRDKRYVVVGRQSKNGSSN